jgi:hypothetical protein
VLICIFTGAVSLLHMELLIGECIIFLSFMELGNIRMLLGYC